MIKNDQKVGLLTVVEVREKDARCRCECGAIVTRSLQTLRFSESQGKVSACKKCSRERAKETRKAVSIPRRRVREVTAW